MDSRVQYFLVKMWHIFGYVSLLGLFLLVVRYFWQRRKLYWLGYQLDGPPTVFLLGNSLLFNCKEEVLFKKMKELIEKYSNPIRVWLGPKLVIIIKDALDIEKVLTSPVANNKDDIYRFLKVFNGLSLFTTNGSSWKRHRKVVTPLLGKKWMEVYLELIKKNCITLVEKLDGVVDKGDFDIDHYFRRCCNDVVFETLLGHNPKAQEGCLNDFIHMIHQGYILVHARMLKIWLHPDFLFRRSGNGKQQMTFSQKLREYFQNSVAASKLYGNNNGFVSIYDSLQQIQEKNKDLYGNDNVMDHVVTLFSASEDTTSTVGAFLFLILGMYPDIQNKIVEEIHEVLDEDLEFLTYKHLTEMKYLDRCVKEVMRLFPIGPYISRKLNGDLDLGRVTLPKDTTVVLSFYSVQRSKEHWQKPDEFYPDHFLPEHVSKRHPCAYTPFSAGARACPGQLFAFAVIKTVAISVLKNFVVEADGKLEDIKIRGDISIRSINGYNIRLRKRQRI